MGRIKDYILWHVDKYGVEPTDLSRSHEYRTGTGHAPLVASYDATDLADERTVAEVRLYSPSVDLLLEIQRGAIDLYDIAWRDLERIVADLLAGDGWAVELQGGTKDGGVDILATKSGLPCGDVLTVWQAKRLGSGRKVGLSEVRELADTRHQFGASKGVIVTSSFLTKGALSRIQQDAYLLGKVDREDLREWIRRYGS